MNYRHAYHAGNFADVVKHIILSRILVYFMRKDTPFFVLDTHAGQGRYTLTSTQAQKTCEYVSGISRFMENIPNARSEVRDLCASYQDLISKLNPNQLDCYPGSPLITQSMIRMSDRLSLVELHPEDFGVLKKNFNWAKNTKTYHLNAWQAMKSQLPPKEKRGLVFIDPSYEDRDEFNTILKALHDAQKRFSNGTYMIWYPVKDRPIVESFCDVLSGMNLGKTIDVRLMIDEPGHTPVFAGTGMVIVNPPYILQNELKIILPWLVSTFEIACGHGSFNVTELVGES